MESEVRNNNTYYKQLLDKFGYSYKSLNWGSKESQASRFQIIKEIGIQNNDRILDVGCGLADFYQWLVVNNIDIKYTGIDISIDMIKAAHNKEPKLDLHVGSIFDINREFEYIVASGIFVYNQLQPLNYMITSVSKMFEHAIKGVAFNSLSTWANESKDKQEFHADPSVTLDLLRKNITRNLVLRHDYKSNDFTVYLYK